ncbi:ABC transporter permease [Candidatus Dependentiae bacterium]|nr:ABC transporter permease [Candidatus Dependentiae bacterium]
MNARSFSTSLRVFGWLLWNDVRRLGKDFFSNLLDASAWPTVLILVNGYVMPSLGMPEQYGAFTAVSMVVIMGAYTAWAGSMAIAADLAGERAISYELTLPLPYWMVWIKCGLALAIRAAAFNITPLIIGKLLLGNRFDLSNFSLAQFILIYSVSCLFFGMFALWSTVITKTPEAHSRLELRLIGPMFFLNGWTASWNAMYAVSSFLGVFVRFLPWIYAYEGVRASVLGQEGYLNIWMCSAMLMLFTVLIAWWSLWLFKRRMDCL